MSSITFLVSAVMTIFVLHAFDESTMASAVDRLDVKVQVLAETAIDNGDKIDLNQSLKSSVVGSSKIGQSTVTTRIKSQNTVSAI